MIRVVQLDVIMSVDIIMISGILGCIHCLDDTVLRNLYQQGIIALHQNLAEHQFLLGVDIARQVSRVVLGERAAYAVV